MASVLVEYRLVNPDGTEWGRLDTFEFDTTYCMPGHPFRIWTNGEWWIASGLMIGLAKKIVAPFNDDFHGRDLVVFTYKQENPDSDVCE